jgi:hypothetical protein
MDAIEFTQKKRLLQSYRALTHDPAYAELAAVFTRHQQDAIAGLRNRNTTREKRDEYLQAGEDADELMGFVEKRIAALDAELKVDPEELEGIEQEG